jgi:hypothetical protein
MPVDQTGENIIFVMEPGKVEAHIQIQYQGDAAHFSWVLPVQALPEVEVGSQALFNRLLAATVPTFGFTTQFDSCGNMSGAGGFGGGVFAPAGSFADASAASDGGVNIVLQKTVGAFEVIVLSGGTSQEVLSWLDTNGYQTPPNASALFQDYVSHGYLFVAVKLTGGAGIDEIHPLVVRYAGTQPCVPIKLTAVGAVQDMGVRTFFLGTKRVVPRNYKHVIPNPVRLNWFASGANYKDWIGRAVDSPVANGHAFITEYAGPTAVVGTASIAGRGWDASTFTSLAPVNVITTLQQQGFLQCFGTVCSYNHPLLLPLLREYLPAPTSLTAVDGGTAPNCSIPPPSGFNDTVEGRFYSNLSCYASQIDTGKWNGPAFASDLASRIIDPARHADSLLASWSYLTRMFTTISPAEMTDDPEFQEHDDPSPVRISGTATRRVTCTGSSGMTLPDGMSVALAPQSSWPGFTTDMPWAERIEEFPSAGAPIVLVDNSDRIASQVKLWNDSQGWPPKVPSGTFGPGGTGGNGGSSSIGQSGQAGQGAQAGSLYGNGSSVASDPGGGCSCSTLPSRSTSPLPSALLALAGLFASKRRRRT